MTDFFFLVCAPDYHDGRPDLETAALFDCAGVSGSWSAWFRSQNAPFEREASITLASTFVIAIEAARRGAGVTLAHDTIVAGLLEEGALVRPFAEAPALPEGYFLLPPSRHAETPAPRAFRDWIGETVATPSEAG